MTRSIAHPIPKTPASSRHGAPHDAIEWEELPSLADSLTQRRQPLGMERALAATPHEPTHFNSAWTNTMPADLVDMPPTEPFRETLRGLETREVNEPEVFRHFFG
jgi:hypothetical protein